MFAGPSRPQRELIWAADSHDLFDSGSSLDSVCACYRNSLHFPESNKLRHIALGISDSVLTSK